MEILKSLARVMVFLLLITSINCYQMQAIENTVYVEIKDTRGFDHWYKEKVVNGENYCVLHFQWETVKVR